MLSIDLVKIKVTILLLSKLLVFNWHSGSYCRYNTVMLDIDSVIIEKVATI